MIERKCLICKKGFKLYPSHTNKGLFCSNKCYGISFKKFNRTRPDVSKRMILKKGIPTGHIPWNKGKKGVYTEEQLNNIKEGWGKIKAKGWKPWNTGKPVTEEQRQKLAIMNASQSHRKTPTSLEVKVIDELKKRNILFEFQKFIKNKWSCDFYIPSINLIIEADGEYWHSQPKTIKKDFSKNKYLTICGYKLLRLSEASIKSGNFRKELDFYVQ